MTVPHFGKREPGLLTAASPGDTLYFAFASYNDSGDSEVLSNLAVTDIEVIKNGLATVRATDSGYSLISDTGMVGDRAGLYRCSVALFNTADDSSFYASGSWYNAFIDAVTIDGRTVRFHLGSWEIGRQKVNAVEFNGDTGAANWAKSVFANGFGDTGLEQRLAQIQSDVDTGLRAQISDVDTGLHDTLSDYDTGLRGILQTTGVSVAALRGDTGAANWLAQTYAAGFNDTGINQRFAQIQSDVDTGLRVHIDDSDTGLKDVIADLDTGLRDLISDRATELDTGIKNRFDKLAEDTGGVNVNSIQGDTGAAGWLKAAFLNGFNDTGLNDRLGRIGFDVDTGLRAQLSDVDTGLHDAIADLDTGIRDYIDNTDTGLRARIDTLAEDTGGVNINSIAGDTGAAAHLAQAFAAQSTNSDTGLIQNAATIRAKTDSLTFTVAGQVDANIQSVNDTAVQGTGASTDEWRPV